MANTDTRFKKGQSGNPAGRPKGLTARSALRQALAAPTAGGRTRLMEWAEDLCTETDPEMRLSILKFLEGSQPPPDASEAEKVREDIASIKDFVEDIKATAEGAGSGPDVGREPGGGKRVRGPRRPA